MLKAKLANYIDLPQNTPEHERNDAKHIRILIPCVAKYLENAHRGVLNGNFVERQLVKLLEKTLKVVTCDYAWQTARKEQIDLLACFPQSIFQTGLPKIRSFIAHRLPPFQRRNLPN